MTSEFAKEKVFWTRKMNLKLVHFIQGKPHIWNPKHSKYTSIAQRDHTYSRFAAKYGNQFSGQAVKDRWTNIRSTFASYVRKLKVAAAAGREYKVTWQLWEPCQFLLKVTKGQEHETTKSEELSETDDFDKKPICIDLVEKAICIQHSYLQQKNANLAQDEHDSTSDECDQNYEDTKRDVAYISSSCKTIATDIAKVFSDVQNRSFGFGNTKNSKIGRKVTTKLSQMNALDAARASHTIMEVLLKYEERNSNNPDNYTTNMKQES